MGWIFLWGLSFLSWLVSSLLLGLGAFFLGLGVIIILTPLLVYRGLAPRNLFFTLIEEGTAKIVLTGGEFQRALIAWKDHTINEETWEIEETRGAEVKGLGGLRFYGIPPFQQIFSYHQRWTHLHEDGAVKEHDEWLDFVFLKTDFYVFELPITEKESAEDINGMPVAVSVVMPIRIINPYEALFLPRRWLAAISGVVKPVTKRFVARYRYKEDLLDMKAGKGIEKVQVEKGITTETGKAEATEGEDLRAKLWQELKEAFKREVGEETVEGEDIRLYGVQIERKGTDVLKIDPSSVYRKFTTMEYEANQEATVKKITATATAEAKSDELAESVIRSIAKTTGETPDVVRAKIARGDYTKEEVRWFIEEVRKRMAIDTSQYFEQEFPSAPEGVLFGLISALRRISASKGGTEKPKKAKKGGGE